MGNSKEVCMSTTDPIRVLVADDHPVTRSGLHGVLESHGGIEVVAHAADGEQAVTAALEVRPDVIVMDVLMPNKDGVEACREILEMMPETKVLMLTASTEENAVIAAVAAGATGYLLKYSDSDALIAAVHAVAEGRLAIPDDAVTRAFQLIGSGDDAPPPGVEALTDKERHTLTLFCSGMSYKQIAEARGVGMTTVRNAIYQIQNKLGVGSKQEIVVWAVRNGLLEHDQDGGDAGRLRKRSGRVDRDRRRPRVRD